MCLSNTFIGNETIKQILWLKQVAVFLKDLGVSVNKEAKKWWKPFKFSKYGSVFDLQVHLVFMMMASLNFSAGYLLVICMGISGYDVICFFYIGSTLDI